MTTFVAIGCSSWRDYNCLAPLTALFWRDVISLTPIVITVGDWDAPARPKIALDALFYHRILNVGIASVYGYEEPNVAQNVRQHSAALAYMKPDDWMMPSDADLWPLRRDFYHLHEKTENIKAVCLYANGDHFQGKEVTLTKAAAGTPYQTLPTCHVVMRVADWRERYGLVAGESIGLATKRTLDVWLKPKQEGKDASGASWEAWMSDQRILTEKLCRADWFPREVVMVEREGHPPKDRIDRSLWPDTIDFARMTDAHLLREPDSPANWAKLRPLVAHFLPQHLEWADDYITRYRASY